MTNLIKNQKKIRQSCELIFLARKALEKAKRLSCNNIELETIASNALMAIPTTKVESQLKSKGKHPSRADWPLVMITYLSGLPDFDGDIEYDKHLIAKQSGYAQNGIGSKGFEGDLFIDDNNRCFCITAACSWDGKDDEPWHGEWDSDFSRYTPEYKTRNGVDVSSLSDYHSFIRRTSKDCPRINLWTRAKAERHQLESEIYVNGISNADQFFILSAAAETLSVINQHQTHENNSTATEY